MEATEKQQLYIQRLLMEVGGPRAGVELVIEEKKWWGTKRRQKVIDSGSVGLLTKVEASLVIDKLLAARDQED